MCNPVAVHAEDPDCDLQSQRNLKNTPAGPIHWAFLRDPREPRAIKKGFVQLKTGKEKHININIFAGLSMDWVGG